MYLDPDREFTISELADRAGTSPPTATREVDRGIQAGILTSRRLGRNKLVKANQESAIYEPLAQLLLRTFSPLQVLASAFARVEKIERLYVFGSWAARYAGKKGAPPHDIDVMVIGHPDRGEVYEAANEVERSLDRPVQVTIRTPAQWRTAAKDPFLREVQQRPLVEVPVPRSDRR